MMSRALPLLAALGLTLPAGAQQPDPRPPGQVASPAYADLADLVLAAPVVAVATVRSTTRLKGTDAAGAAPGTQRLYIEADVQQLIRGADGLPPRIGYLLDAPLDARGRPPSLKKARVLLFARSLPDAPGQVQLVAPDAQLPWGVDAEARVRKITQAALAADAPPRLTGVGRAFHVPGALPGEGETQVFLQTADNRPVSLSVLRRPGERPHWAVALSEIVDEAAGPPARDTLLWYRLACFLPRALPPRATGEAAPADAESARADYAFVLAELGPCTRKRG